MASKYQKRHYEDVAQLLKDARSSYLENGGACPTHGDAFICLMDEFAHLFGGDNSLFNKQRFLKACGLEEGS